jgi:hypothetical protein
VTEGKEVLAPLGHEWGDWTAINIKSTIPWHYRTCERCSAEQKEDCTWKRDAKGEIDSLPVDIDMVVDVPGPDGKGYVKRHLRGVHYCRVCTGCGRAEPYPKDGGAYAEEEVAKPPEHEHQWVDVPGRLQTCTVPGCTAHQYCSICGLVQNYEPLTARGHTFGDWQPISDATHARVCNSVYCGRPPAIETGDCVWSTDEHGREVFTERDGKRYRTCILCGQEREVEGPYTLIEGEARPCEHTWEEQPGKAPDCLTFGYTAHRVCSKCGVTEGKEVLAPLGHEWGDWIPNTSNPRTASGSAGRHSRNCQRCPAIQLEFCTWKRDAKGEIVFVIIYHDKQRGTIRYGTVCSVCEDVVLAKIVKVDED